VIVFYVQLLDQDIRIFSDGKRKFDLKVVDNLMLMHKYIKVNQHLRIDKGH